MPLNNFICTSCGAEKMVMVKSSQIPETVAEVRNLAGDFCDCDGDTPVKKKVSFGFHTTSGSEEKGRQTIDNKVAEAKYALEEAKRVKKT
jgi:hypothetical protein